LVGDENHVIFSKVVMFLFFSFFKKPKGMMCARGKYLLMADADGATKFSDYFRLQAAMTTIEKNGLGFVVGSRAHLQEEAIAKV
jgi:hypothetical protein